jgi:predicted GNAT superfamily acetyltransferase
VIGASFGFLGRHHGDPALHSHVTGILPGVQHSGVGRAMKNHQRAWAFDNGLPWVTWTFDPLVRRNAWFNIEVLGARIADYLVDFYGPMNDAVNSHDETDRLVAAWSTTDPSSDRKGTAPDPKPDPDDPPEHSVPLVRVATPDDIVVLRRTDPASAMEWRHRVRHELGDRMAAGASVIGFTRSGDYLVRGVA